MCKGVLKTSGVEAKRREIFSEKRMIFLRKGERGMDACGGTVMKK